MPHKAKRKEKGMVKTKIKIYLRIKKVKMLYCQIVTESAQTKKSSYVVTYMSHQMINILSVGREIDNTGFCIDNKLFVSVGASY